jgi:hypothetical protein
MSDGNPQELTASVDGTFEAVVTPTMTSQGFRPSRRAVTRRDGDLYFSLRLRPKPNQPWGSCVFSLVGGVAVRQCLPFTPRAKKPYDVWQRTVPWQTVNYGFKPDTATKGASILTTASEVAHAVGSERDAFINDILDAFRSVESVREHLWHAFSTGSNQEFRTAQTVYQWRFLAVLLAAAGDAARLEQVQTRMPGLWSGRLPTTVEQDWDSLWREAKLG